MSKECEHFSQKKEGVIQNTKNCEECEKEHLPVVAIRMCLTCGHVVVVIHQLENMQQNIIKKQVMQ